MWKVPSGDCKIFTANGSPCENGVIMPDGKCSISKPFSIFSEELFSNHDNFP